MFYRTIDLRQVFGITFFCSGTQIFAIHAHTKADPSAETTCRRFISQSRRYYTWVFFPILKHGPVIAVGMHVYTHRLESFICVFVSFSTTE